MALHLASTILLFLVLKRMTGARWPSAAVAALFALHPLHVESVAWIAERKDVLSTLFWMLTMGAYVHYVQRRDWTRFVFYGFAVLCLALGLMAKPMLVTLPFVLLLLDFWPLRRFRWARPADEWAGPEDEQYPPYPGAAEQPRPTSLWLILAEKVPLFALSAVSSYLTYTIQQDAGAMAFGQTLTLLTRIETATMAYAAYLSKTVVPIHLAVIYPYVLDRPLWQVAMAGAGLALATVAAFLLARRRPYLTVGWLWFLGTLVPVIGLVQVGLQPMADRYTYVPLTGLFIAAAWLAADLAAARSWARPVVAVLGLGAVATLAIAAGFQVKCWHDSESLFRQAVTVKGNYVAENNLAAALLVKPGLPPNAIAEALQHAQNAVDLKSDYSDAYCNIGLALANSGDTEEAIRAYREAIRYNAGHSIARANLSAALISAGRFDEAIEECRQADPSEPNTQENWAIALQSLGKDAEAREHFAAAVDLSPRSPENRLSLALCWVRLGKPRRAIEEFRAAISLQPNDVPALNGLACILATDPDPEIRNGKEAVDMATRAVAATRRKDTSALVTLAAAYAETGRFKEAVDTALEAQKLAHETNHEAMVETLRRQLELYRAGKPFHTEPAK